MTDDEQITRTCVYRDGHRSAVTSLPYDRGLISGTTRRAPSGRLCDIDPAAFVLTGDDVPPEFTALAYTDDPPLVTRLREVDRCFKDAAIALTGYWTGTDDADPPWVVASLVCVCNPRLNFTKADIAAKQCHDDLAKEYEDELPDPYSVKQSERLGLQNGQWCIDLIYSPRGWECQESSYPVASDLLRLQWRMNVLSVTVVYGPCRKESDPKTRLDHFADLQLTRFNNWRET